MARLDRHQAFELNLSLNPHLKKYIGDRAARGFGRADYVLDLQPAMKTMEEFNFIYPVAPPAFIHASRLGAGGKHYIVVEPAMSKETSAKYDTIAEAFRRECGDLVKNAPAGERGKTAVDFVDRMTRAPKKGPGGRLAGIFGIGKPPTVQVSPEERLVISLRLVRDTKDHGALTPVIGDPYVDEMVSAGGGRLDVVHKVWGTMETGIKFGDARMLDALFEKEASHPGRGWEQNKTITFRTSHNTTGIIQR